MKQMEPKKPFKLWQIGFLIFILGGLANAVIMKAEIGGISREFTRLLCLIGIVVIIVGCFQKKK